MNQNDMERYFWRTGHRWSGDNFPFRTRGLRWGPLFLLAGAFVVTLILSLLLH